MSQIEIAEIIKQIKQEIQIDANGQGKSIGRKKQLPIQVLLIASLKTTLL